MENDTSNSLTAEQRERIQSNRRKALERQQERKRAAATAASTTTSPIAGGPDVEKAVVAKKRAKTSTLFDYDLSTMRDSKGGFLLEDQPDSSKKLAAAKTSVVVYEHDVLPPPPSLPPSLSERDALGTNEPVPKCRECDSLDLDAELFRHYRVHVCASCRQRLPERYTLLTKTEVKEDYLLTDEELADTQRVPFWERPNPHKKSYARMKLYLRQQVEQFAYEKWGGPEGLDAEWERRVEAKQKKQDEAYAKRLKELRRRTRLEQRHSVNVSAGNSTAKHQHELEELGDGVSQCRICGLEVEIDEL